MNIPFSPPDISEAEISEVIDTLKSGWITTGPKVKRFESLIAEYCGTEKSVCLNSVTSCMEVILRLFAVGQGDEVITSAYTYTASASVIHHVGAHIVLVDTQPDSYEMDYNQLADAITERTKVIIPVDIGGVMCDYRTIFEIIEAKKHLFSPHNDLQKRLGRILLLADAAHSFGSSQNGIRNGSIADFTAFSFHAVKNLTTGEGGSFTWRSLHGIDDTKIYTQSMLLSLHGQSKDALAKTKLGTWEYDILYPGYKSNMTDIAASLGLAQLARYPAILERRRYLISLYNTYLSSFDIEILAHSGDTFLSNGHLYMIRFTGKNIEYRNKFIYSMTEKGVACNVHFKPLPLMTAYKNLGFSIADYPNAFNRYKTEMTLPLYSLLSDEQVSFVVESFISCIHNLSHT